MNKSHEKYLEETTLPVAKVLSRLEDVELASPGWYRARCPACANGTQLTVIEGRDGRVLLECDDGCWLYEIVTALGLATQAEPSGRWWCGPIVFDAPRSFPDRIDVP